MEALFVILNHPSHMDRLLIDLRDKGITAGTILESQGLAATLAESSHDIGLGYLRMIMNEGRPYNKTLFFVLPSEHIEIVKESVRAVTGGLHHENSGLMFTMPVSSVEGLGQNSLGEK
ncbi:MAG: hypothetical protein Q4P08_03790 [Eubacteriales bacterium]|nr:hypothetical protein [Eubacteriales bacterium]